VAAVGGRKGKKRRRRRRRRREGFNAIKGVQFRSLMGVFSKVVF
jgi:hypothetical protein